MPKYNQLLMDRYSDVIFLIRQVTKQHQKFNHAWNHINYHPNIVNDTISRQKKGFFSAIYNSLFGQTKN